MTESPQENSIIQMIGGKKPKRTPMQPEPPTPERIMVNEILKKVGQSVPIGQQRDQLSEMLIPVVSKMLQQQFGQEPNRTDPITSKLLDRVLDQTGYPQAQKNAITSAYEEVMADFLKTNLQRQLSGGGNNDSSDPVRTWANQRIVEALDQMNRPPPDLAQQAQHAAQTFRTIGSIMKELGYGNQPERGMSEAEIELAREDRQIRREELAQETEVKKYRVEQEFAAYRERTKAIRDLSEMGSSIISTIGETLGRAIATGEFRMGGNEPPSRDEPRQPRNSAPTIRVDKCPEQGCGQRAVVIPNELYERVRSGGAGGYVYCGACGTRHTVGEVPGEESESNQRTNHTNGHQDFEDSDPMAEEILS